VHVEHRLAEDAIAALRLERQQRALNRADRRDGDVAVLGRERAPVLARS
jgi:hypothetical protein